MKAYLRGVSVFAAVVLTLTACGGGGSDTKRAASRPPGTGTSSSEAAAPAGGDTASSAPAAPADASGAPAAGTSTGAPAGANSPAATPSGGPAQPSTGSGGATGSARAAGSGSSPAALSAAGPGDKTGVTQGDVLFGIHMPLSGPFGVLVGKGWYGTDAYFRSVNDAGGVNGRKLKLVVADDKYSAQGAATAIRDLVDTKKVFAVACPVGVDQCSVTADYANSKGVPFLSGGFREQYLQDKPWAFPLTASYLYGGVRLLDYLFEKRGYTAKRKIGLLWLHSQNLDEMGQAADRELARLTGGGKFAVRYPAEKDQSDFSAAVTRMHRAGVDTVWFHTAPDLITKFAAQAKLLGYQPQYIFTLPVGGDIWAAAAGGNLDKGFGLAGFADPQWSGTAKFQETFHRYYPNEQAHDFNLLCYVIGVVYVEGLKKAGPDLGRDSFARAMNTVEIDTGISQPISYSQRGRVGGPNSKFAVWEIHGTHTDQVTGFDF
ncbi:MAG TPA: ABC transporter substrate-binding protein [Acidimicrobiia bacterium]|nr:ABC transporter substrate-binding protein [Acidimicrobiia bacterium]